MLAFAARISRSVSSGARARDPLAHAGYVLICPSCQSAAIGIIDLTPKSETYCALSRAPQEGRLHNRHGRWVRDAVDAAATQDERRHCGRRSRVVLPLSNKIKAMRWLTGILRALIRLGFLPVCLTV